jgi:outer membrane protein OmpA-like peptidoglycan-associated protein
MKNILFVLLFTACFSNVIAQNKSAKKPPTIGLHFFYNDFASAQSIKTNGFATVVKNKLWNKPNNMQGGFGIDYMQGIAKKIDAVGTINGSWVDYLLPSALLYGSNNFLLDVNAGVHIKMFTERRAINPFLITKVGYSSYKNLHGFTLHPGAGIQANFFNEALVLVTAEYRKELGNTISNQLYYSIGIAANFKKAKTPKKLEEVKPAEPVKVAEPVKEAVKAIIKNMAVLVKDEATGQPLQFVAVTVTGTDGKMYNETSNADGLAFINNLEAADYNVTGRLNKIDAAPANISKNDFNIEGNQIAVTLLHNDPRFTLVGNTVDKTANKPVANTEVTINNTTQNSTAFAVSNESTGEFRTQLEPASDFTIVGKKANYISNIETISTKGLNRSATLYVKLQLGIEEATAGKSIVLNKLYFETGKASINTTTSADLQKLVRFLIDNPNTRLEIQGHTDNSGSLALNNKLSQLRANSVVDYLVKNGIASERLIAKGFGPTIPIAGNNTAEGKAQNRRVEIKVLE